MKRIKSKIVCLGIPGTLCNLDCSYCYAGSGKGKKSKCRYSVDHMVKCFEPKRFGGNIWCIASAGGETLLWDEIVPFTEGMLSHGHITSYATNMTITPVIKKFCEFPADQRSRLELKASLHYLELKRKKLLDVYFENLRRLKSAGISITIFLCIAEDYIPYLYEISELCQKEIGLLPIAGMLRNYDRNGGKIAVNYSSEVDKLVKETCDVRQWELQKRVYGQKRTEFCHAGENSINLNLETGDYVKCWRSSGLKAFWEKSPVAGVVGLSKRIPFINKAVNRIFKEPNQIIGNLFKNPDELIKFEPIGRCPFYDCVSASYLCWGLIPEFDVPTHSRTYFTRESVSKEVWDFCDSKLG